VAFPCAFLRPLLRSATVRKFMVGFELLEPRSATSRRRALRKTARGACDALPRATGKDGGRYAIASAMSAASEVELRPSKPSDEPNAFMKYRTLRNDLAGEWDPPLAGGLTTVWIGRETRLAAAQPKSRFAALLRATPVLVALPCGWRHL